MIFGFNTDVKYGDSVYHVQSEARVHDLLLQTQVFVKGRCIGKRATSYADQVQLPGFSDEHMHNLLKEQHRFLVNATRAGHIEDELANPTPIKFPEIGAVLDATHTDLHPAPPVHAPTVPTPAPRTDVPRQSEVPRPPSAGIASPQPAPIAAAAAAPELGSDSGILDIPLEAPPVVKIGAVDASADVLDSAGLSDLMAAIDSNAARAIVEPVGAPVGSGLEIQCSNPETAYDGTSLVMKLLVSDAGGSAAGDAQLAIRVTIGAAHNRSYSATQADGSGEIRFDLKPDDVPNTTVLVQATFRGHTVSRRFRLAKPA